DSFTLADFKGRYLLMDIWATWCAPCKIESPNFERLAEQYTSPKLAFVALSIDDNFGSWRSQASEKSPRVLQLIANDKNAFGKSYGIETIPRFILLGPDGKIINIQMPYPSDSEFEAMLKREISDLAAN
ncbi:MAG TPA: TlpA disulfide reductase family protein, partial [Chitinophagaceae bacterium]|nr:TlpA disulfide reductase family protein [Chitinophagaceae bacterium]